MDGLSVKLYIYDISKGLARSMSRAFIGRHVDGVWHTGVVCYDKEWFYGGAGIQSCPPKGTILGTPDKIFDAGETGVPLDIFIEYLAELGSCKFMGEKYHLFDHNCNTFSSEVIRFLTGSQIPTYITDLPSDVASTPFGQMLRQFYEGMANQLSFNPSAYGSETVQKIEDIRTTTAKSKASNHTPDPPKNATIKHEVTYSKSEGAATVVPIKKSVQVENNGLFGNCVPVYNEVESGTITDLIDKIRHIVGGRRPILYVEAFNLDAVSTSRSNSPLLDEIIEYCITDDCNWSLGYPHLNYLEASIHDTSRRVECLEIIRTAALKHDFLFLLTRNQIEKWLFNNKCECEDDVSKLAFLKMICNLCQSIKLASLVVHSQAICPMVLNCLMEDGSLEIRQAAAKVLHNATLASVPGETSVEIAAACSQCLIEPSDVVISEYCIYVLSVLVTQHNETIDLLSALSVQFADLMQVPGMQKDTYRLCSLLSKLVTEWQRVHAHAS